MLHGDYRGSKNDISYLGETIFDGITEPPVRQASLDQRIEDVNGGESRHRRARHVSAFIVP